MTNAEKEWKDKPLRPDWSLNKQNISVDEKSVVESYRLKEVGVRLTLQCSFCLLLTHTSDPSAGCLSLNLSETTGAAFSFLLREAELAECCLGHLPMEHNSPSIHILLNSPLPPTGSSPPPLLSFHHSDPKIWLPRALRQTYIRKVDSEPSNSIPGNHTQPTLSP